MSGFNTKERNNNGEFEITFYTENQQDFKKVQDLCRELIGHGTPVSNEGDLISRSELKKAVNDFFDNHFKGLVSNELITYAKAVDNAIDTAPTVEPICPYLSDDEVKQPCLQAPCERPKVKDDVSCQYCKYDDKASTDYPCNICKNNHPNMFEWKEDNK